MSVRGKERGGVGCLLSSCEWLEVRRMDVACERESAQWQVVLLRFAWPSRLGEQRAESREQRAESREQRAESIIQRCDGCEETLRRAAISARSSSMVTGVSVQLAAGKEERH
jgi:hypothetical protein